jgi:hypothetical protein
MKKEYIFVTDGVDYKTWGSYVDIESLSVRYRVDDDSDLSDPSTWYVMGIDVAEEPESVKRQKERDKKIDAILK